MSKDPDCAVHLFISYAGEDSALAEWLTRKLTAEGYRVWCDRFKLLGGESYPKDIDEAIKHQTFRMLALLSRHSISKDNPVKERTLALSIGKEHEIDFLIPLNVDGLTPTELNWMTSDLTFIPFHRSWAVGLQQLLKKLDSINAPRPLKNGAQIAVDTFLPVDVLTQTSEPLYSNCLKFQKIPAVIKRFRFERELTEKQKETLSLRWAFYWLDPMTVLAFQNPPTLGKEVNVVNDGGALWEERVRLDGITTTNIVSSLLYKSLCVKCLSKGLQLSPDRRLYFPQGVLEKDKMTFLGYDGNKTWVLVTGERSAWSREKIRVKYRYHLSPEISVRQNFLDPFIAQLRIRLHLTDSGGQLLPHRSALARRKRICKF
jgi:hypothetical protein